jgi:hypothetical protein
MQIWIGATAYEVDAGMSVETLKAHVENKEFIPAGQMCLVSNGKLLIDGTLEGNGIQDEDEVVRARKILYLAVRSLLFGYPQMVFCVSHISFVVLGFELGGSGRYESQVAQKAHASSPSQAS